jgi:RNA polymerase sigma-70 factor (ECF subfamily)
MQKRLVKGQIMDKHTQQDFTKLVMENKRRIYTVCYMFSKNPEEVADLFQEIIINLWKGLQTFKGDRYLSTWVWKVSLNTCINYSKKEKRKPETVPLDVNMNLFDDTDESSAQIRQLYERINRLGVVDRSIILMWLENMSYDDIGSVLGITANNVSVKLVRIREKLKAM